MVRWFGGFLRLPRLLVSDPFRHFGSTGRVEKWLATDASASLSGLLVSDPIRFLEFVNPRKRYIVAALLYTIINGIL